MPFNKDALSLQFKNNSPERVAEDDNKRLQIQCINSGGTWDGTKCIAKTPSVETPFANKPTPTADPVLALARERGLSLKNAADILVAQSRQSPSKQLARASASATNVQQAQTERGIEAGQLLSQAESQLLTPEELRQSSGADVNIPQAIGQGLTTALPAAAGGAAVGLATGGVLSLPLGIAGAVGGFLTGVRNSIKNQQTQEFIKDQASLTKGTRFLRSLITDTNQNPENAAENIELYYKTINFIDSAHAKTRKDASEDLNIWLGNDGGVQLTKFDIFDSTLREYYQSQFQIALANPNPNQLLIGIDDIDGQENTP